MKNIFFILFLCFLFVDTDAQTDSSAIVQPKETVNKAATKQSFKPKKNRLSDTLNKVPKPDSASIGNTSPILDSNSKAADSTVKPIIKNQFGNGEMTILKHPLDSLYNRLLDNPFFNSKQRPVYLTINEKHRQHKDEMFYLLIGLMFFLALIKLSFSKYFTQLFRQFAQPFLRINQTPDNLSQNNFPSLMLNLFFIFSLGVYVALLVKYYSLSNVPFEINFLYSALFLFILYTAKYVLLSFAGWVFNAKDATETYIFIVFLVNKIMGIVLLPFSFIIAFSQTAFINVGVTISLMFILVLFSYRYIASINPIKRELKISFFHFVFYILAFEITPLLLLYKTLGYYLAESA